MKSRSASWSRGAANHSNKFAYCPLLASLRLAPIPLWALLIALRLSPIKTYISVRGAGVRQPEGEEPVGVVLAGPSSLIVRASPPSSSLPTNSGRYRSFPNRLLQQPSARGRAAPLPGSSRGWAEKYCACSLAIDGSFKRRAGGYPHDTGAK